MAKNRRLLNVEGGEWKVCSGRIHPWGRTSSQVLQEQHRGAEMTRMHTVVKCLPSYKSRRKKQKL